MKKKATTSFVMCANGKKNKTNLLFFIFIYLKNCLQDLRLHDFTKCHFHNSCCVTDNYGISERFLPIRNQNIQISIVRIATDNIFCNNL